MASDEEAAVNETQKSDDSEPTDPRLDFFSDQFDPLLALQTPDLKIPNTKAKLYDNVQSWNAVYSKKKQNTDEDKKRQSKSNKRVPGRPAPQQIERRFLPHQMPVKSEAKRKTRNVLTRMEKMEGPLSLLRMCKDDRVKIKIWTRNDRGIRGYCTGYVVAFDKYWNLALEDVEEVWTRARKRKVPAFDTVEKPELIRKSLVPPAVTIVEQTKKTEKCMRHLDQLMMRGEHVAFIVALKEGKE